MNSETRFHSESTGPKEFGSISALKRKAFIDCCMKAYQELHNAGYVHLHITTDTISDFDTETNMANCHIHIIQEDKDDE